MNGKCFSAGGYPYAPIHHEAVIPKDIFLPVQEEPLRRRVVPTSGNGKRRCCSWLEASGHACHSRTVKETVLELAVIDAINRVLCRKDDFLQTLRANIGTGVL